MARPITRVSICTGSSSLPQRRMAVRKKPISKSALWATKISQPSQKWKNCSSASLSVGAPATISLVILVSRVISGEMAFSGSTKVSNESMIWPFSTLTAPISMMRSLALERPVVSRSNTIYRPSITASVWPFTAGSMSLMK